MARGRSNPLRVPAVDDVGEIPTLLADEVSENPLPSPP